MVTIVHTHTRGLGRTLNKMVATSTLNYITNLSHIERKRRCFKLLLHIPAFEKAQIAGLAGAATVRFSRGNLRQGALAGGDLLLVAADQLERLGLGARDGRFLPGRGAPALAVLDEQVRRADLLPRGGGRSTTRRSAGRDGVVLGHERF